MASITQIFRGCFRPDLPESVAPSESSTAAEQMAIFKHSAIALATATQLQERPQEASPQPTSQKDHIPALLSQLPAIITSSPDLFSEPLPHSPHDVISASAPPGQPPMVAHSMGSHVSVAETDSPQRANVRAVGWRRLRANIRRSLSRQKSANTPRPPRSTLTPKKQHNYQSLPPRSTSAGPWLSRASREHSGPHYRRRFHQLARDPWLPSGGLQQRSTRRDENLRAHDRPYPCEFKSSGSAGYPGTRPTPRGALRGPARTGGWATHTSSAGKLENFLSGQLFRSEQRDIELDQSDWLPYDTVEGDEAAELAFLPSGRGSEPYLSSDSFSSADRDGLQDSVEEITQLLVALTSAEAEQEESIQAQGWDQPPGVEPGSEPRSCHDLPPPLYPTSSFTESLYGARAAMCQEGTRRVLSDKDVRRGSSQPAHTRQPSGGSKGAKSGRPRYTSRSLEARHTGGVYSRSIRPDNAAVALPNVDRPASQRGCNVTVRSGVMLLRSPDSKIGDDDSACEATAAAEKHVDNLWSYAAAPPRRLAPFGGGSVGYVSLSSRSKGGS